MTWPESDPTYYQLMGLCLSTIWFLCSVAHIHQIRRFIIDNTLSFKISLCYCVVCFIQLNFESVVHVTKSSTGSYCKPSGASNHWSSWTRSSSWRNPPNSSYRGYKQERKASRKCSIISVSWAYLIAAWTKSINSSQLFAKDMRILRQIIFFWYADILQLEFY